GSRTAPTLGLSGVTCLPGDGAQVGQREAYREAQRRELAVADHADVRRGAVVGGGGGGRARGPRAHQRGTRRAGPQQAGPRTKSRLTPTAAAWSAGTRSYARWRSPSRPSAGRWRR